MPMNLRGIFSKEKVLAFFLKVRVLEWKFNEEEKKLVLGWRFKW